jgi:tetratricopeptide (TPR) repeat protein
MAESSTFVERLKRHHMFQIAAGYATVAYFLILVANAVFPDIGLTRGEVRYVIAILALGFPLALVFGWLFIKPVADDAWLSSWQRLRWRITTMVAGPAVALVAVSGIYLWHLNGRLADGEVAETSAAQVVAVLPFGHSGAVDDAFMAGLRDSIDNELSLAGVSLIAVTSPALTDPKAPIADVAKATGATLLIRGSVQQPDAKSDYEAYFELVSAADGVTLDSRKVFLPASADPIDVQKTLSTIIAARAHLLGILDHYFAPGYPSTKDAAALQFFRRGLLNYMNADFPHGIQMLRAAVKLDPNFAQAHAYIAYFEAANPDADLTDPKALVDQELALAERVPGLPEAVMARASRELYLDVDPAAARKLIQPVAQALANTYNAHMLQGFILREQGDWQGALREFQAAASIDPYSQQDANHIAQLGLALRHYDEMDTYLGTMRRRWPLSGPLYLGQAQVRFSGDGDLERFAKDIGGDLSSFGVSPDSPRLALTRLEVAHFQGKHVDVVRGLKTVGLPHGCPGEYQFPELSVPELCADPFTAESLRLAGKDQEAADFAKLRVAEWNRRLKEDQGKASDLLNLALLQAFGNDPAALSTVDTLLKGLDKPVTQWDRYDGLNSLGVAVVLAWSDKKQEAVQLLSKSLDATYGAHAALVAIDPVWRPLYKTPEFTALLASHGVTLTRAP